MRDDHAAYLEHHIRFFARIELAASEHAGGSSKVDANGYSFAVQALLDALWHYNGGKSPTLEEILAKNGDGDE